MDIALKARVDCSYGEAGHIENIVLNPVLGKVTFLVVKASESPNAERMVPEKFVVSASHERVALSIDKKRFHGLKEFVTSDYLPPNLFMYLAKEEHETLPMAPSSWTVEHENVPEGSVVLRRHTPVFASDGKIGKVDEFLAERRTGRITHLILREGHFFGTREIQVPLAFVERFEESGIHLKLDKEAVELLPVVDV